MIAATALEYVTGAVMERLFKVRYWDYSYQKFNLNGYICLSSSIAWGFFSILLVRFIHPPIARLLLRVPSLLVDPLALALTVSATVDAVRSVQDALDLRETLTRLTEENEELRRLAKRAEVAAAFAEDDLRRFRARTELNALLLRDRVETERREEEAARAVRRLRCLDAEEARIQSRANAKLEILDAIEQALQNTRDRLESTPAGERLAESGKEIAEIMERVRERRHAIRSRSAKSYRRSLRLLRNNPTARAREFSEALDALRSLNGRDKR
jgi:hypothetical protein